MWRNGRIAVISYLDVDTRKYQYRLLNQNPLYCITSYIMEYDVGDRSLKRLPRIILNLINGYILSYCFIINSLGQLDTINQANKLASVLGDIYSDRLGESRIGKIDQ